MTEIAAEQTIWFPGIYSGREGNYAKLVADMPEEEVIKLVQHRAKEDGEWAIENNRVGGRAEFMRKMMAWVSNEKNIRQCLAANPDETVDWICRDLANATKRIAGGLAHE